MGKDLVFYDGECGFCDQVVQFLLRHDQNKIYVFAPLQGEMAKKLLKKLPEEYKTVDSLVLVEDYLSENPTYYVMGKAAFRILWQLGGFWTLVGSLNFLPSFLYDWGYRLVARNRQEISKKLSCQIPDPSQKDRFLP